MKKTILLLCLTLLSSCASSVSTYVKTIQKPLENNEPVAFFDIGQPYPAVYQYIGNVKIGDSGLATNCNFEMVIALANEEARKMGGNAIRLIKHEVPATFGSSCHQIEAQVLKIEAIAMNDLKKNSAVSPTNEVVVLSQNTAATPTQAVISSISKPQDVTEKITINVNYGPAFRIGQLPSNLNLTAQKHLTSLKSGSGFEAAVFYKLNQNASVGVKYNYFNSKVTTNNFPIVYNDGTSGLVPINSDHQISFFGVAYVVDNRSSNNKFEASLEMALGYMGLEQLETILGQTAKTTGSTFGLTAGLGYKYRVLKNVAIGPQLNIIGGVIKELKIAYPNGSTETIKYNNNEGENLWRIDLNFGISIRL